MVCSNWFINRLSVIVVAADRVVGVVGVVSAGFVGDVVIGAGVVGAGVGVGAGFGASVGAGVIGAGVIGAGDMCS